MGQFSKVLLAIDNVRLVSQKAVGMTMMMGRGLKMGMGEIGMRNMVMIKMNFNQNKDYNYLLDGQ